MVPEVVPGLAPSWLQEARFPLIRQTSRCNNLKLLSSIRLTLGPVLSLALALHGLGGLVDGCAGELLRVVTLLAAATAALGSAYS